MDSDEMGANLTLAFEGEGVRDGTIDASTLGPALIALGSLFDQGSRVLYGEKTKIDLRVRTLDRGCFEVDFSLVQSIWQQVQDFLVSDSTTAVLTLRDLMIFGAGGVVSLVGLVKWLKGAKPDKAVRNADSTITIEKDGARITIPADLLKLYQDVETRKQLSNLAAAVDDTGIDEIQFKTGRGLKASCKIDRQDRVYFCPVQDDEIDVNEQRFQKTFSLVNIAFKDDNKWRLDDGTGAIYVKISDEDFLGRVYRDEVDFSYGDTIVCDVVMRQRQSVSKGLATEYEVEKVVKHIKRMRQLNIPLENPDTGGDNSG